MSCKRPGVGPLCGVKNAPQLQRPQDLGGTHDTRFFFSYSLLCSCTSPPFAARAPGAPFRKHLRSRTAAYCTHRRFVHSNNSSGSMLLMGWWQRRRRTYPLKHTSACTHHVLLHTEIDAPFYWLLCVINNRMFTATPCASQNLHTHTHMHTTPPPRRLGPCRWCRPPP